MKEWFGNETTNLAKTILGGCLGQAHSQGVGNVLCYQYTRKTEWNNTKYTKIQQENVGNSLPTEDMSWLRLVDEFWQRFPLLLVSFCKNQQAKACWKCWKTPQKLEEIFCLTTENFHTKIWCKNDEILTYLRDVKCWNQAETYAETKWLIWQLEV